jgi:hypothetical protein
MGSNIFFIDVLGEQWDRGGYKAHPVVRRTAKHPEVAPGKVYAGE